MRLPCPDCHVRPAIGKPRRRPVHQSAGSRSQRSAITMEAAEDSEFLDAMRRARIRGALVGVESVTAAGLGRPGSRPCWYPDCIGRRTPTPRWPRTCVCRTSDPVGARHRVRSKTRSPRGAGDDMPSCALALSPQWRPAVHRSQRRQLPLPNAERSRLDGRRYTSNWHLSFHSRLRETGLPCDTKGKRSRRRSSATLLYALAHRL
jgi:hypothetical protein